MACKCKFLPHNWFCLKGLYWIFVSLFYLTVAYAIYIVILMSTTPMLTGAAYWENLFNFLINAFSIMLGFITVAKIIKALAKIKKAVAPCCCEARQEEVVVVSSQDK